MYSFLIRILLFFSALWIVQRFLGLLMGGHRRAAGPAAGTSKPQESNRMVKDPVCGMYLDSRLAIQISAKDGTQYFCSQECRNKYTSNPV